MNRTIALILLVCTMYAERITVVKDNSQYIPYQPPQTNLMLNLISDFGIDVVPYKRFQPVHLFANFSQRDRIQQTLHTSRQSTINVLVLRVEFVEDTDSFTTGTGHMDTVGLGDPDTSGLFYDPPHTKTYFERHMQFLTNYYKSNSFGNLNVNWIVKPDGEHDNYQLPHEMAFYSVFDHYDEESGFVFFNVYAMEVGLVRIFSDAVAAADQDPSIDFSDYDAIVIFHAGAGLETSLSFFRFRDIWSVNFGPSAVEYYTGSPYVLANNGSDTIACPVAVVPEMERIDEYMVGVIGTVCHEFGHVLGLPDLYDVTGISNGVGAWALMGTGGWVGSPRDGAPEGIIPANMSAWSKYVLGWVQPKLVNTSDSLVPIRASSIDTTQYDVDSLTMVKVPISESEFFLIENRKQDMRQKDTILVDVEDGVVVSVDYGEYDFFCPGSGILIWHIDNNVVRSWSDSGYNRIQIDPNHKGVDVEEADGIQHFDAWWYGDSLEYYGSAYDLFFIDDSNKANTHFGPLTNPNSDSYYGKSLISIETKSEQDTVMDISVSFDMYQAGFPVTVSLGRAIQAVSYGDLDGDSTFEIVVATKRGHIYAFNHDGTQYGWAVFDTITTYLSIGDINNDGADDILFGAGRFLHCLDGTTLTPLDSFPFASGGDIMGAPLLYDINGDSHDEIIFGSKDRNLYCLDSLATNIAHFPLAVTTELLSTPCVFDSSSGTIGVLGSDGRFWLVNDDGIIREFDDSEHNMLTFASPVVGDMDRDGNPEAVTINGYGTIYVYGEDSLEQKFDILIDTTFYATPALADLDNDGFLEIIMLNSSKTLYVTNRNGVAVNDFPLYSDNYLFYPLTVADLDDNGTCDITFGAALNDSVGSGQLKIINDRNQEFLYSPLFGEGGFTSPGVMFDLDSDGDIELACGSDTGKLYVWDFPGNDITWSGYMNSRKNWGCFTGELIDPQVVSGLLGSFYIYPSPVETSGRVRYFLNQEATITVEILDIVGHTIGSVVHENATANEYNELFFDFERQSNGVYLVRIEADNGSRKEVKIKKFAVLK